jgi:hypothetical protein
LLVCSAVMCTGCIHFHGVTVEILELGLVFHFFLELKLLSRTQHQPTRYPVHRRPASHVHVALLGRCVAVKHN